MANLCNYEMKIVGEKKSRDSFIKALTQDGSEWIGRGGVVNLENEDEDSCIIFGYCKWSINASMIKDAISMRTEPENWDFINKETKDNHSFITLPEASAKYNLNIEAYSEEPGCCFAEHLLIRNGQVDINETTEYHEYYIGDYETKEEAEKETGLDISDEEWGDSDYITSGGFNGDFEI